jgi:LPS O-antigen subunit length determinant protein (WzzB/FepE family)
MSSTESKDLNKEVEKLEAAAKKYASKDTVISIGGYEFTPAKLMVAFTLVSSLLGGLYGTFEVYQDYIGMKKKIANYVAPDFSEYEARIIKLEADNEKMLGYTRDVNTNLKGDIRRTEQVLEGVERGSKTAQREVEKDINDIRRQVDAEIKEIRRSADSQVREMQKQVDSTVQNVNERVNRIERDTNAELRTIRREVDDKIKKALDNPLAN